MTNALNARAFHRICHETARVTGGRVAGFRVADQVTPNFHEGVIAYPDRSVVVLCARDAALLAFARPDPDAGPREFIDAPALETALREAATGSEPFQFLTAVELSGPFEPVRWPHLRPSDVRYWQPASLGEALFHHWD